MTTLGARHDPLVDLFGSRQVIFSVVSNMFADLVLMLVSSWSKLIDPELFVIGPIRNFYLFAITIIVGLSFYFLAKPASRATEEDHRKLKGVFLAGALIVATGMISAYVEGYIIHLKVAPWNSRFSLPVLLGLALLVSGLIELVITSKYIRHIFLAVLVGLLIGFHNRNTLDFKYAWEKQERLYQQLMWRAPTIQARDRHCYQRGDPWLYGRLPNQLWHQYNLRSKAAQQCSLLVLCPLREFQFQRESHHKWRSVGGP